ncbi:MAG: hypothetical protein ACLRZH_01675 [Ruthenibacterium lactatiformans]
MKKCAAGLAALFLIVIFLSPRAFAAGYELPEGTSITAQSAYFVNLDTGIVVFEQNADEQRSVASLTKLMTALLLMENGATWKTPKSPPNEACMSSHHQPGFIHGRFAG